eukprot:47199_1
MRFVQARRSSPHFHSKWRRSSTSVSAGCARSNVCSEDAHAAWIASEEGVRAWRAELEQLRMDRKEKANELKIQERAALEEEISDQVKSSSFSEKLYKISMTHPNIWRKMKRRELEMRQLEDLEHLKEYKETVQNFEQVGEKDSMALESKSSDTFNIESEILMKLSESERDKPTARSDKSSDRVSGDA